MRVIVVAGIAVGALERLILWRSHAGALDGDEAVWGLMARHALHGHPEVGLDLPRTQQRVLDELAGAGLEITTGRGLSSVVAVLRGGAVPGRLRAARPTVLLRSDMDGLPVEEWLAKGGGLATKRGTFFLGRQT